MTENLHEIAAQAAVVVGLRPGDLIVDIGCNDGTLLDGYGTAPTTSRYLGIDPSDVTRYAVAKGDDVINDFFSQAHSSSAFRSQGAQSSRASRCSTTSSAGRLRRGGRAFLADDGVWVIEFSYMPTMLERTRFDTICHEHLEYYSLAASSGCSPSAPGSRSSRGAQRRQRWQHRSSRAAGRGAASRRRGRARAMFAADPRKPSSPRGAGPYEEFAARTRVPRRSRRLLRTLSARCEDPRSTAPRRRGTPSLQFAGIDPSLIDYAADRNPDKWGSETIGTHMPIISEEESRALGPTTTSSCRGISSTSSSSAKPSSSPGGRLHRPAARCARDRRPRQGCDRRRGQDPRLEATLATQLRARPALARPRVTARLASATEDSSDSSSLSILDGTTSSDALPTRSSTDRCLDVSSSKLLPSLLQAEGRGKLDLHRSVRSRDHRVANDRPRARARHPGCNRPLISRLDLRQLHLRLRASSTSAGGNADALAEMWRVLKPGGALHLTTDVAAEPRRLHRRSRYGMVSPVVEGRGFFFKHDYTPPEVDELIATRPWESRRSRSLRRSGPLIEAGSTPTLPGRTSPVPLLRFVFPVKVRGPRPPRRPSRAPEMASCTCDSSSPRSPRSVTRLQVRSRHRGSRPRMARTSPSSCSSRGTASSGSFAATSRTSCRISSTIASIDLFRADLADTDAILDALATYGPSELYNFASVSFGPDAWDDPIRTVGAGRPCHPRLLEVSARHGTLALLSRRPPPGCSADLGLLHRPRGALRMLRWSRTAQRRHSRDFLIRAIASVMTSTPAPVSSTTTSHLDGPTRFVTRKITSAAASIAQGLGSALLGDVEAQHDWGYTADYVRAAWLILQADKPADYVIATGKRTRCVSSRRRILGGRRRTSRYLAILTLGSASKGPGGRPDR